MATSVRVVQEWRQETKGSDFVNLEDETCWFLQNRHTGVLTSAIRPYATDAVFNGTQLDRLLAEMRGAAAETPVATIAENLRDVVRYVEERLPEPDSTGDYSRYVICVSD